MTKKKENCGGEVNSPPRLVKSRINTMAIELLKKVKMAGGYWRSAKERKLFQKLKELDLVAPTAPYKKPKGYHIQGHCLFTLTPWGESFLKIWGVI